MRKPRQFSFREAWNHSTLSLIRKTAQSNDWSRWLVGVFVVAVIATIIGPFGTFDLGLGARLVYWLAVVTLGSADWLVVSAIVRRLIGKSSPWPPVARDLVVAIVAALPLAQQITWIDDWLLSAAYPSNFAQRYLWVALTALAVCIGLHILRNVVQTPVDGENASGPSRCSFLERIPANIAGELLCLKTEDHYLRVYTSAGDDLILCRMKDAIKELTGADGLRVHRSYWVARQAVRRVDKKHRKIALLLENGLRVPVSQTYAPGLRGAGWY